MSVESSAVSVQVVIEETPEAVARLASALAAVGGRLHGLATQHSLPELGLIEMELTVVGLDVVTLCATLGSVAGTRRVACAAELGAIYERRGAVIAGRVGWPERRGRD